MLKRMSALSAPSKTNAICGRKHCFLRNTFHDDTYLATAGAAAHLRMLGASLLGGGFTAAVLAGCFAAVLSRLKGGCSPLLSGIFSLSANIWDTFLNPLLIGPVRTAAVPCCLRFKTAAEEASGHRASLGSGCCIAGGIEPRLARGCQVRRAAGTGGPIRCAWEVAGV